MRYLRHNVGGVVASWLVPLTPEQAVQVRALAGDIELCSWAKHIRCINGYLRIVGGNLTKL